MAVVTYLCKHSTARERQVGAQRSRVSRREVHRRQARVWPHGHTAAALRYSPAFCAAAWRHLRCAAAAAVVAAAAEPPLAVARAFNALLPHRLCFFKQPIGPCEAARRCGGCSGLACHGSAAAAPTAAMRTAAAAAMQVAAAAAVISWWRHGAPYALAVGEVGAGTLHELLVVGVGGWRAAGRGDETAGDVSGGGVRHVK